MARSEQRAEGESAALRRLAEVGVVRLPDRPLSDVLAARGPLAGPVSRAGSDAVAEQRGERG